MAGGVPVIPSQDGKAALALVNFDVNDIGARLKDGTSPIQRSVEALRAEGSDAGGGRPAGLRVRSRGQIADLFKAFGGIDGILLVAAFLTVLVILLVVYRSPVIPLFVLLSAGLALSLASVVVYLLAEHEVITLNGQSQGILSILVVGAATDYALLLVARYKEELRRHDDRFAAMRLAWRRVLASRSPPPPAPSSSALLCLLLADLGPTRGLGPVGSIGIAASMLAALTLPARTARAARTRLVGANTVAGSSGRASRTSGPRARRRRACGRASRDSWVRTRAGSAAVTMIALLALAVVPADASRPRASRHPRRSAPRWSRSSADEHVTRHFPAGSGSPTIIIGPADAIEEIAATVGSAPGVSGVVPTTAVGAAPDSAVDIGAPPPPPQVVDGLVELAGDARRTRPTRRPPGTRCSGCAPPWTRSAPTPWSAAAPR